MDFEQITYAIQGTTAIVTLNRPERRNKPGPALATEYPTRCHNVLRADGTA